jgi:hypothetical protein
LRKLISRTAASRVVALAAAAIVWLSAAESAEASSFSIVGGASGTLLGSFNPSPNPEGIGPECPGPSLVNFLFADQTASPDKSPLTAARGAIAGGTAAVRVGPHRTWSTRLAQRRKNAAAVAAV